MTKTKRKTRIGGIVIYGYLAARVAFFAIVVATMTKIERPLTTRVGQ
jgi:hypothetical protein